MKTYKIVTLFPDFFTTPFQSGLLGKAIASEKVSTDIIDLRSYSQDKFHRCDDYPYGGGSGMVLKPEPLFKCLDDNVTDKTKVVLTTPGGVPLDQKLVKELSNEDELCIICGHYEGIDQRVSEKYVDLEVSVGDYVLSGGEYAALILIDATARYVPGFMSNAESLEEESFENNLLEYPHYTRPAEYENMKVPDILLSGHHEEIRKWRMKKSVEKTKQVRPDLYKKYIEK